MSTLLDARLCLLDYLHRSANPRTVQEILSHLHANTAWGQKQLANISGDQGLRTVQSWLQHLRESSEFGGFVDAIPDVNNRRRLLYQVDNGPSLRMAIPIEEALLLALAEKHLELVIPEEFRAQALNDLFLRAHETIERFEANLSDKRPAIGHYLQSVAVHPRGQAITARATPYDTFATLSSALLHKQCIMATYNGRRRHLHPCAIVVRSPKLYLIAIEDKSTAITKSDRQPKTFSAHLLGNIEATSQQSRTTGFNLQEYIREQKLEAPLAPLNGESCQQPFHLMLRLHPNTSPGFDALLEDLELHPLNPSQKLIEASDQTHHMLSADSIVATEALANWIVSRLDRVEVISPLWLRTVIASRIQAVQKRYEA